MSEEIPSECHVLNKDNWLEIKQKSGAGKGQDPVVLSSGYVYAGKEHVGKEVRLYVKK
jgi:hypothetical protein